MKTYKLFLLLALMLCGIQSWASPESEPNNTKATANTLAVNGSNTGAINVSGDEDWYSITTTKDGKLDVTITISNSLLLRCYLYDNDGTILLNSGYSSTTTTITKDGLAAGKYYIKLIAYTNGQLPAYTVSNTLTEPAQTNDAEPNNTKAQAKVLALNNSKTGHIGYYYNNLRDTFDWYKVTTNADGRLRLKMESANGNNVYAYLYDNDGTTLLESGYTAGSAFVVNKDGLAAGTYYIKVKCYYGTEFAPYTLSDSLFTPAQANDPEPDNTSAQAVVVAPNSTVTGHINYLYNNLKDTFDWYKITIPEDGNININFTSYNSQNFYVYFYDNDGTTLLNSDYTSGNKNYNVDGLQAGTYYMRIKTYYAYEFVPYALTNTFTTYTTSNDAEPNKYPYQAKTLNANSTATGHSGFYYNNQRDSVDWYKINYTGSGNLTLNITQEAHISDGSRKNFYVYVYKDTLAAPISSTYSAAAAFTVNLTNLTQQYYYIKLRPYYNYDFVSYSIEDVFTQVNVAKIKAKAYDTLASCSNTNNIIFQPTKSAKPYTVQLFRFGIPYGAPVITSKSINFKNLPTGSYYAIAYGDGATGSAFGKSRNVSVEPVPVNLSTTNITDVKAKVNWDAVDCAGYYTVQYRVQGDLNWTTKKTKNTTPSYSLKGLTASTMYEWHVATSDSANGIVATGQYSAISNFTTDAAFAEGKNGEEVSLVGKGNLKEENISIAVFPNPASNYFTIRYNSTNTGNVNAILYNMNGKAVWTSGAMNASAMNGQKVTVNQFASGLYYLKIIDEKGAIQSVIKVSVIK